MEKFTLNNGLELPEIGIGTYKAELEAIKTAIKHGCRYFDTASFYGNENLIAEAIASSGLPRQDFIIASKLWKSDMGYNNAQRAFSRSLENLQTDYIDVYYIHWPVKGLNIETWRALEEYYYQGKIRALGLSNFLPYHAEEIINNCDVYPAVAQLEFHAGHTQAFALKYYRESGILLQAWSPLARGRVFNDELILDLAKRYDATPAQICISFCLAEGVMPIPRASNYKRLKEYLGSVKITLSVDDIMRLENMPPIGWSGEHPDRERVKI